MSEKREEEQQNQQEELKQEEAQAETEEVAPEGKETEKSPLEIELDEARAKADENWDRFVRLQAEVENLRRRGEKQVEDAHKYAVKNFVESLLPVADSLEMGLAAEGDIKQIRQGMDLTLKVLLDAMSKHNVEAVDPLGEPFNPDYHQAVSMQQSVDYKDNDVINVMQKGYTLNGRVIRPAMVVVCKN